MPLCFMNAKVCLLSVHPVEMCYCSKLVFCTYCWKVCKRWQCFGSVVVDLLWIVTPVVGVLIFVCFVVHNLMSILVLQSS